MYPKSKSPLETKYERLRGMCGGAWENVRYIPIDNGMQQHGRAWRYMVGDVCISAYRLHGGREARYTNATSGILVYDIRYTNTVYNRHRQSFATPGCVYRVRVRACVILLYYYNIIILLYYYIYIYPIYPIYPVYLIYPIYPTMVI